MIQRQPRETGAVFIMCPNWTVGLYVPDLLFKILQRAERAKGLIAFYVRVEPGFLILLDILLQAVSDLKIPPAQKIIFVWTNFGLFLRNVFRLFDHDGLGIVEAAAVFSIRYQGVRMGYIGAKGHGKGCTIYADIHLRIRP